MYQGNHGTAGTGPISLNRVCLAFRLSRDSPSVGSYKGLLFCRRLFTLTTLFDSGFIQDGSI